MSEIRRTGSEDECGFPEDSGRAVMPVEFREKPEDKRAPSPGDKELSPAEATESIQDAFDKLMRRG